MKFLHGLALHYSLLMDTLTLVTLFIHSLAHVHSFGLWCGGTSLLGFNLVVFCLLVVCIICIIWIAREDVGMGLVG